MPSNKCFDAVEKTLFLHNGHFNYTLLNKFYLYFQLTKVISTVLIQGKSMLINILLTSLTLRMEEWK
jgi:hypothetical protein